MESGAGRFGEGRRLPADVGPRGGTAGPRGGNGRDVGGGEGGAEPEPTGIPQRVLPADVGNPGGEAGVASAAGSARALSYRGIRAVPAEREGLGGDIGRDLYPGRFHAQGKGRDGGVVRQRVLLGDSAPDQ